MIRALGTLVVTVGIALSLMTIPTVAPVSSPVVDIPVAIDVPAIDALSDLHALYREDDTGELSVPPLDQPMQAGWYSGGVKPGEVGPAVIAAHVNGNVNGVSTPGLFARLHELVPGDVIYVLRADESEIAFVVYEVNQYPKDEFPTERVYGNTSVPEIRLITCGGEYIPDSNSYSDNIVVYAKEK